MIETSASGFRLLKNLPSGASERVKSFNDNFDNLWKEFHNEAARDTSLVVHRVWHEVTSIGACLSIFFAYTCLKYTT